MPIPRESTPDFALDVPALRAAIEASGLSGVELERRARLGQNYLYRVLDGSRPGVSAVMLARLAHVLRVRVDDLLAEAR